MAEEPKERVWVVERRWGSDDLGGDIDLGIDGGELAEAAIGAATVVKLVGGVVFMGADREELDDGSYQTQRIIFRWSSYLPARRRRRPRHESETPVGNGQPVSEEPQVEAEQAETEEPEVEPVEG